MLASLKVAVIRRHHETGLNITQETTTSRSTCINRRIKVQIHQRQLHKWLECCNLKFRKFIVCTLTRFCVLMGLGGAFSRWLQFIVRKNLTRSKRKCPDLLHLWTSNSDSKEDLWACSEVNPSDDAQMMKSAIGIPRSELDKRMRLANLLCLWVRCNIKEHVQTVDSREEKNLVAQAQLVCVNLLCQRFHVHLPTDFSNFFFRFLFSSKVHFCLKIFILFSPCRWWREHWINCRRSVERAATWEL